MTEDVTAYRDQLAAERGITDDDRDLLMTGADEDTLLKQANLLEPLLDLTSGNRAPKEGKHVRQTNPDRSMNEFVQELIHGAADTL